MRTRWPRSRISPIFRDRVARFEQAGGHVALSDLSIVWLQSIISKEKRRVGQRTGRLPEYLKKRIIVQRTLLV
jgi:hypothetical protein